MKQVKYVQISVFTRKRLRWRPFKYSCRYEAVVATVSSCMKKAPPQMLSCENCEVLQDIVFKENCWKIVFDL